MTSWVDGRVAVPFVLSIEVIFIGSSPWSLAGLGFFTGVSTMVSLSSRSEISPFVACFSLLIALIYLGG